MGIKSKLIGLGATSLLALSMTTGVMAAPGGTAESDLSVHLQQGQCSIELTSGDTIDFGDYKWDGNGYVLQAGTAGSNTIAANILNHKPGGECTVTVTSTAIGPISASELSLSGSLQGYGTGTVSLGAARSADLGTGSYAGAVGLNVPNSVQPDASPYSGTLNFTIVNAGS
jgi:hypothetical protein